jgi:bacterioferritin-associated ferredoxin
MSEVRPDKTEELVCYCSGTTQMQIKGLIEKGVDNLDRISRMTGACSGCGSCDTVILELLAEARSTSF